MTRFMTLVGRLGVGLICVELLIIGLVLMGSEDASEHLLRRALYASPFFLVPLSAALSKNKRAFDFATKAAGVCSFLASSDLLISALHPFSADRIKLALVLWAFFGVPGLVSVWKTRNHPPMQRA